MIPIIVLIPFIQLIILSYTATFELKSANIAIIDKDLSEESRSLTSKISAAPFFNIKYIGNEENYAHNEMKQGNLDQILIIPSNFSFKILSNLPVKIQIINDAVNSNAASVLNSYTSSIIFDFNKQILLDRTAGKQQQLGINTTKSFWYNPELDYKTFMVPGILVLLVSMIGAFLSGMNIVREKEIGTIEQLNVTPIKKHEFIIGKLLPFWIIGILEFCFGLLIARLLFNIPIEGSLLLIISGAAIYLFVVLGLGLFVSTITDTQQQAMFFAWFFMVIFIMMSGLFTPLDAIPDWAKILNKINPIAYFIDFMRKVMLIGSDLRGVLNQFLSIVVYAFISVGISVLRYRKVT
jgi:ABC-2 type transport system permease protein